MRIINLGSYLQAQRFWFVRSLFMLVINRRKHQTSVYHRVSLGAIGDGVLAVVNIRFEEQKWRNVQLEGFRRFR